MRPDRSTTFPHLTSTPQLASPIARLRHSFVSVLCRHSLHMPSPRAAIRICPAPCVHQVRSSACFMQGTRDQCRRGSSPAFQGAKESKEGCGQPASNSGLPALEGFWRIGGAWIGYTVGAMNLLASAAARTGRARRVAAGFLVRSTGGNVRSKDLSTVPPELKGVADLLRGDQSQSDLRPKNSPEQITLRPRGPFRFEQFFLPGHSSTTANTYLAINARHGCY